MVCGSHGAQYICYTAKTKQITFIKTFTPLCKDNTKANLNGFAFCILLTKFILLVRYPHRYTMGIPAPRLYLSKFPSGLFLFGSDFQKTSQSIGPPIFQTGFSPTFFDFPTCIPRCANLLPLHTYHFSKYTIYLRGSLVICIPSIPIYPKD